MNIKKLNIKTLAWAIVPALLIGFSACGDDEPTQPTPTSPAPTTSTEQYILMDGLKVKIKNPANGSFRGLQGDTIIEWSGNKPTAILGDSSVSITHYEGVKRGLNVVDQLASEYGEVSIGIQYGITDSKTEISLKSGDYKLEKINGIWYSVLKNGAGEATKGTNKINLTGIEFRIAWPSTFK
jgi:hypothetical protein